MLVLESVEKRVPALEVTSLRPLCEVGKEKTLVLRQETQLAVLETDKEGLNTEKHESYMSRT